MFPLKNFPFQSPLQLKVSVSHRPAMRCRHMSLWWVYFPNKRAECNQSVLLLLFAIWNSDRSLGHRSHLMTKQWQLWEEKRGLYAKDWTERKIPLQSAHEAALYSCPWAILYLWHWIKPNKHTLCVQAVSNAQLPSDKHATH